ncbi:hypothetical protein Syun_014918 [Stephania yunnanensis]|uniref:Phosphofructokinase domain-containing protein n=1 Tax=Stephania yunnanensis TaxID=152371 RepID=A0AAP0JLY7_9MAGN
MDSDFGVPRELSDLQKLRANYQPELPPCLQGTTVRVELGDGTAAADPLGAHTISRSFPHTYGQPLAHFLRATAKVPDAQIITEHPVIRVGVVFCGRQSPGGHNVIWGLYNALKIHNLTTSCLDFLVCGTDGLFAQKTLEITDDILSTYKNQGGYDLLGRTKDQIRSTEQVNAALNTCKALKLDGLVIIGGVTSNTDAAQLAETFAEAKCQTKVVGVPVTLNGDLKNQFVETNVGFDTICKVNSQLISNVCTDALSAEKVILAEEVAASKLTLFDITKQICDAVQARAEQEPHRQYHPHHCLKRLCQLVLGCTLLHLSHLHQAIVHRGVRTSLERSHAFYDCFMERREGNPGNKEKREVGAALARAEEGGCRVQRRRWDWDKYHGVILLPEGLIESIPEIYALLQEIHGLYREGVSGDNISSQLSPWASALFEFLPPFIKTQIETEKLLAHLVEAEMNKRLSKKLLFHTQWSQICTHVMGTPDNAMMTVKRFSHGPGASSIGKPAIHPATIDLKGKAYDFHILTSFTEEAQKKLCLRLLSKNALKFLMDDIYRNPGPLQFDGPGADNKAVTLSVEDQDYMGRIKKLQEYLEKVRSIVKPGCSQDVLKAALSSMASVTDVLTLMTSPGGSVPIGSLIQLLIKALKATGVAEVFVVINKERCNTKGIFVLFCS